MTGALSLPEPGARKRALCELMPRVALAAEVGADHGITSAHLLREGICGRMILSDISAASLEKARRLFALHGLQTQAQFRVADGLDALREPVDAILISGIGARTMCDILKRGRDRIGWAALVLQARPNPQDVRRWLMKNGYAIECERLAYEGGRFYPALRAVRGQADYTEKELLLGPCLLRERPQAFEAYLTWHEACLLRMQSEYAARALRWVREEMKS